RPSAYSQRKVVGNSCATSQRSPPAGAAYRFIVAMGPPRSAVALNPAPRVVCRLAGGGQSPEADPAVGLLPHLLGQVGLFAQLLDQAELGLEPVEMLFLALEDVLEEVAGRVVTLVDADCDALVQPGDRLPLDVEVERELLGNRLADPDASELLQ